jgi:glycosyltransferase involved in cell wall biosynthesis
MAMIVRRRCRSGLIFDIRGLMAEEYVDAGTWRPGSLPVRLVHWVQRRAADSADGVVVLTERLRRAMFAADDTRVLAIPCCVDVAAVAARAGARQEVRRRLRLGDAPVLIYVGKLSRWYRTAETLRFFLRARDALPGLRLLIVSQDPPEQIAREMDDAGVDAGDYVALRSAPAEIGDYLAAADAAILLPGRTTSEISSSPTKIGEYLAAGLPIVWSAGLGDFDRLLRADGQGVEVDGFSDAQLSAAAAALAPLIGDRAAAARRQAVAMRELDLETVGRARYGELYRRVLERRQCTPA